MPYAKKCTFVNTEVVPALPLHSPYTAPAAAPSTAMVFAVVLPRIRQQSANTSVVGSAIRTLGRRKKGEGKSDLPLHPRSPLPCVRPPSRHTHTHHTYFCWEANTGHRRPAQLSPTALGSKVREVGASKAENCNQPRYGSIPLL